MSADARVSVLSTRVLGFAIKYVLKAD